jgi:aminopeptidase
MIDLKPGAANAVHVCMGVGSSDRVVILTDKARKRIGDALADECETAGAEWKLFVLEDFTERPAKGPSQKLVDALVDFKPTTSFYAATALKGELAFRRPYMEVILRELKVRHGHMVGIDENVMEQGMRADYNEIARITARVNDAVKGARHIEVQAPSGTDLRATFDPTKLRWKPCPGFYTEPATWGNLPEGETFTSPVDVEGVIGAEVLGDHFSEKCGVLDSPAKFHIAGARVKKVEMDDKAIQAELEEYLQQDPNSNRVGEYAIGTNVALKKLCGNLLQDEKVPGVHIAFGDPYAYETGADWACPSHLDVLATKSTIKVDGQYLMKNGEFVI